MTAAENTTNSVLMLILVYHIRGDEMSETKVANSEASADDSSDGTVEESSEGISQPVSIYTGPKALADAKIALGKWLDEHGL
jgi:hypothetical protein